MKTRFVDFTDRNNNRKIYEAAPLQYVVALASKKILAGNESAYDISMGRLDYVSKKGVTNIEHAYKRLQILLLHILMTGCPCEGVSRFTNGIESGTIEVIKCKTVPFSCFLFFPCVCVCHVLSSSSLTETWKFDGNLEI